MANGSHEVYAFNRKPGVSRHNDSPKTHENAFSKCGGHHNKSTDCPAKGKRCLKCRKFNHYAKVCKTKSHTPGRTVHREIHTVRKNNVIIMMAQRYLWTLCGYYREGKWGKCIGSHWIGATEQKIDFLDTGAQASVIPAKDFNTLMSSTQLMAADRKLTGHGGHVLEVNGYCKIAGT